MIEIRHRHATKLWQNVDVQGRKPPACCSITFQFRFTRFKGVRCDNGQGNIFAPRGPLFGLTLLDRVATTCGHVSPALSSFAGFGKTERWESAKSHLSPPSVNRHTQYPLRAAIVPLHQPKPCAIAVLSGWCRFHE
ncbi:hypothetical protein shim_03900 [Shimia sp. SK013]|nr:hypothetical protein shim_03900 [Shimia sp. SK013]